MKKTPMSYTGAMLQILGAIILVVAMSRLAFAASMLQGIPCHVACDSGCKDANYPDCSGSCLTKTPPNASHGAVCEGCSCRTKAIQNEYSCWCYR